MLEVPLSSESVRPALLTLAADPEGITAVKYWRVLTQEERRTAISHVLSWGHVSPNTLGQLAGVLKIRVQTLKTRPISQAAADLERSPLSPHLIQVALGYFITGPLEELCNEFFTLTSIAPGTGNTIQLRAGTVADPALVETAATVLVAHHTVEKALLLVLGLYIQEQGLRPFLGAWLKQTADRPLEVTLAEARALASEIDSMSQQGQEDGENMAIPGMENPGPDSELGPSPASRDLHVSAADALEDDLRSLGEQLRHAADGADAGTLPPDSLSDAIGEVRSRFSAEMKALVGAMCDLGIDAHPPENVCSVDHLRLLLARWEGHDAIESLQARLGSAREIVFRTLRIHARNPEAVVAAHEDAHRALTVLALEGEEARLLTDALLSGDHPLALLVRAVYESADLGVEEKLDVETRIGHAYGLGLALELAYGRARIEASPEPDVVRHDVTSTLAPTTAEKDLAPAPERVASPSSSEDELGADASGQSGEVAGILTAYVETAVQEEALEEGAGSLDTVLSEHAGSSDLAPMSTIVDSEATPGIIPPNRLSERQSAPAVLQVPSTSDSPEVKATAVVHAPEVEDNVHVRESLALDGLDLTQLALMFVDASAATRSEIGRAMLFDLMRQRHRSLAYHVCLWLTETDPSEGAGIPEWLLRALVLSPHVGHALGEIAYALRDDFATFAENLLEEGEPSRSQAVALLVAASAIRPALLAPGTMAAGPLGRARSHLGSGLDRLWDYCHAVATFSSRGVALDTSVLKGVRGQASWEAQVAELVERTEQWAAHAPRMSLRFPPATRVWMKWQERGGIIQTLLEPVRLNDVARLDFVRAEIARLSDAQEIRKLIDHTDRNIIERRTGGDVNFSAYTQFTGRVREALDLAREWVALHEDAPSETSNYRLEQADLVRRELLTRHRAVLDELTAFEATAADGLLRTAVLCMREAVQDLDALFTSNAPLLRDEVSTHRALNADLLRLPGLDLAEDWSLLTRSRAEVVNTLANVLASGELPSWTDTFRQRIEVGDHTGSGLVLTRIETSREASEEDLSNWRRTRQQRLTEDRGVVRRMADATEKQVDQAVMFGIIGEGERGDLMDRVRNVSMNLDSTESLHRLRRELTSVSGQLQNRREALASEIREEMFRQGIDAFHSDYGRITSVLEQGDLLTAREYIHHVERGHPIREDAEDSNIFSDFFPSTVLELDRYKVASPNQLLTALAESRQFSCVDMAQVPEPQARQASEAMAAWFRARTRKNTPENEVARVIFSFLGFNVLDVTTQQLKGRGSRVWSEIYTEPVRDRSRCPVAYYGSMAAGNFDSGQARYRVLWQWDEPSAEDLIGAVGETSHEAPTFVFYFGKMSEERRRSLARLSRKDRRTFLVLDDILLLYLCGEPAARMPVMFHCALPFTYLEPYVTTASLVPPEIFYGRVEDRKSIGDVHGSCFIYGGRQLGKTALLRDVERNFNDADTGRIALYVDLKGEGIGFNRPVEDIWPLLADKFKTMGVIPTSVSSHVNLERILGEIRKWLTQQGHRRILLLLDEADRFLEGDRDFILVARLKKEMEDTNRRFKVVFAGLHNVQRTTRLGNNPLAHLGEPRCIGPLFENLEWREARDLVKQPLAAIGYRFESEDLVVRILSQTNYYPSLLQLYCTQLLRHVNRPNVEIFDSRTGPPYVITSKHVEDAYQSQELWQRIRERFNWTLDLDPRYRLIALLIAHYTAGDTPEQYREGFSAGQIRDLALEWWARGFTSDPSEESFRALLDEMVGLGILRQTVLARYRMRTGNVALLLGTPEEIDSALEAVASEEPPRGYEAQSFRRPLARNSPANQGRSPLTAYQESLLQKRENGVLIVFGSEAAGLSDLAATLPEVMGESFLIPVRNLTERGQFKRELDGLKERAKDGVTLVVVDASCVWSEYWVQDAAEKITALKSKQNFVRVLFVADPEKTWQLVAPGTGWENLLRKRKITTFTLRPWHDSAVRSWLDDHQVTASLMDNYITNFRTRTGLWPSLAYEMMQLLSPSAPGRWQAEWFAFEETWADPERVAARMSAFGLTIPGPAAVVDLLQMGAASAEELAEVGGVPLETVEQELRWLDLLGFAHRDENNSWALDATVQRLVDAAASHERVLVEPSRA